MNISVCFFSAKYVVPKHLLFYFLEKVFFVIVIVFSPELCHVCLPFGSHCSITSPLYAIAPAEYKCSMQISMATCFGYTPANGFIVIL
jgi:hypothetical protein